MGYREVQEKVSEIQQAVMESSILIGDRSGKRIAGVDAEAGLGMTTYAKHLAEEHARLQNSSLFKILFMGTFKNGKSTTINALLGGNLLPVAATACTAVISQVVYGTHTNTVKLYLEGQQEPKVMSAEQFAKEYKLTAKDMQMIETEGALDRFKDIDHAVLESDLKIFHDGVQFIDSPGLGEAVSRTKTTNRYLPQANAIVFLLDATKSFSADEKLFIRKHFQNVDPRPRNVFFLVNRINMLNTDQDRQDVKDVTEMMLKPVFSGTNGFDRELYGKRVFFVNSYGALTAQLEGKSNEGTGIPEFKQALEEFLTSEDRIIAKYKSVVANMASVYVSAERQSRENIQLMKKSYTELTANKEKATVKLNELKNEISSMERVVDRCKESIIHRVLNSLEVFVKVDLPDGWLAYAEKYDEKFGITDMIRLALPGGQERKQEILAPMVSFVNQYVKEKTDAWAESIPLLTAEDLRMLQAELKDKSISFDLKLDQARSIFAGADTEKWNGGGANKLQLALSLIQGDVSVAVENSAGGNFSWGEYLKRYLVQGLTNLMVLSLVGGGVPGIIVAAVVELAQLLLHKNATKDRLLNGLAERLFPKIGEKLIEQSDTIRNDIGAQFEQQKKKITHTAYSLIEEEQRRQNNIIAQSRNKGIELAKEQTRQANILQGLYARTNSIYSLLFGKTIAKDEMEKVAAIVEAAG